MISKGSSDTVTSAEVGGNSEKTIIKGMSMVNPKANQVFFFYHYERETF